MLWEVNAMLEQARKEWLLLPEDFGAVGAWICLYSGLGIEGVLRNHPDTPQRVWFLDRTSATERNVNSFARFKAVVLEPTWLPPSAINRPSEQVFGKYHEIGLAAIAPVRGTADWYLGFQWGSRVGAGYQYALNHELKSVVRERLLWIS
jgi:hypothetical protein